MRRIFTFITVAILLMINVLAVSNVNAQTWSAPVSPLNQSDFALSVQNMTQTAVNRLEFDVYLKDTDPSQTFEMASIQFGFLMNSAIYAGGTLAASYDNSNSGLLVPQQFTANTSIVTTINGYPGQTLIRLAGKTPPGAGNGTIISTGGATGFGTLVTHFSLTSSVPFAANSMANLTFTSSTVTNPLYATRIAQYQYDVNPNGTHVQLLVQPGINALVCCNPVLNEFYVVGGGICCEGSGGLPIGLSSSVNGEIYTLFRNGIAQTPTVIGTGSAISFGNQLAGIYTVGPYSTGSATVVENPITVGGTVSGGGVIYEGNTTITLTLNGNTGSILKWQKRFNEGTWVDIESTQQTYSEIPSEAGNWYYRAIVKSGVCQEEFSLEDTVTVLSRTLLVKVYLQCLFNQSTGFMRKAQNESGDRFQSDTADVITLKFAQNSPPYTVLYTYDIVGLPTNGIFTINLPAGLTSSYYLVINHRNSIETWSSSPVSVYLNNTNYNFTNGAHKAYGNNLCDMGSWVIFGGNINQDGFVDSADMTFVDNDNSNYATGYLDSDVNGDGIIDLADSIIIDNNANEYVSSATP